MVLALSGSLYVVLALGSSLYVVLTLSGSLSVMLILGGSLAVTDSGVLTTAAVFFIVFVTRGLSLGQVIRRSLGLVLVGGGNTSFVSRRRSVSLGQFTSRNSGSSSSSRGSSSSMLAFIRNNGSVSGRRRNSDSGRGNGGVIVVNGDTTLERRVATTSLKVATNTETTSTVEVVTNNSTSEGTNASIKNGSSGSQSETTKETRTFTLDVDATTGMTSTFRVGRVEVVDDTRGIQTNVDIVSRDSERSTDINRDVENDSTRSGPVHTDRAIPATLTQKDRSGIREQVSTESGLTTGVEVENMVTVVSATTGRQLAFSVQLQSRFQEREFQGSLEGVFLTLFKVVVTSRTVVQLEEIEQALDTTRDSTLNERTTTNRDGVSLTSTTDNKTITFKAAVRETGTETSVNVGIMTIKVTSDSKTTRNINLTRRLEVTKEDTRELVEQIVGVSTSGTLVTVEKQMSLFGNDRGRSVQINIDVVFFSGGSLQTGKESGSNKEQE
ncbi:hypothetical protein BD560DRAFT_407710 [Blakeslea trispora]|nr:hypothetical protein BD560DRAFT_407710 [Blakeslea trispora]